MPHRRRATSLQSFKRLLIVPGGPAATPLAFIIEGIGTRVAESYDGVNTATLGAPLLVVEYIVTDPTISVSGTPLSEFCSEPGVPSDEQSTR